MKKFSDKLSQMLTAFVVTELGSKALDGINYTLKNKKTDGDDIVTYCKIREEADKCGYQSDEVFIVHEYVNGYSFEIEPKITNKISTDLAFASCKITGKHGDIVDYVMNKANARREFEVKSLANKVMKEFKDNSKKELKVVIYNMNVNRYTKIIAEDENGNNKAIVLNSYGIELSDIEYVNRNYLINNGMRIAVVTNSYILKTTNGVCVDLVIEEV